MELLRLVFLVVSVASYGLLAETEKKVIDLPSCNFPAIYNFGDSNSDTGGAAAAFFPRIAPAGETFFHRPVGRVCDGRLIMDFIAEHLGLPLLSPYLDSVGTNFRHGANFAIGGVTIRRLNESWFQTGLPPFPLDIQVEHFTNFKARTAYFYSQGSRKLRLETERCWYILYVHSNLDEYDEFSTCFPAKVASDRNRLPRPQDFSKALYTFDIGQNDINVGFRTMSMEELRATIPDIVNLFALQIQDLYSKGARAFWIHNTGPIGCLPVATLKVQNPKPGYLDEHGCIKIQNDIAMEFNKELKHSVLQLRTELSEAAITYVDIYRAKYDLISNAKEQGFEDPFKICCGVNGIGCGNKAIINGSEVYAGSCANPSALISWDGLHYSEAANNWIANHIANGSLSDPPIPISQACHRKI